MDNEQMNYQAPVSFRCAPRVFGLKSTLLDTIYHFSFKDKEAVQNYLSDPSCAITIYSATDDDVQYGIFLEQSRKRI